MPIAYEALQLIHNIHRKGVCVKLQWIPSHVGLRGNEEVDVLAKSAAVNGAVLDCRPYASEIIPLIKKKTLQKWEYHFGEQSVDKGLGIWYRTIQSNPHWVPWFESINIPRKYLVSAFRLRSGHIPTNKFFHMMRFKPSPFCNTCERIEDLYHVLVECDRNVVLRDTSFEKESLFNGEINCWLREVLRLNTAPVIIHFPSKGKPKPADSMDFERTGIHAEAIAKWIQDRTDVQVRVFRPPNYSGAVAFIMLFALVGGFLYLRRNNLEFLYNKQMWAVAAVFFCFAMVSGQMWNQIRGPPFFHRTKNGPVYINGGSHGQFVLESYIVAILNGAVVVGMILMIEAAGGVRGSEQRLQEGKRRRFQSVIGLVLVCVFFSLLLSVFRAKTQGYPYSFLFK